MLRNSRCNPKLLAYSYIFGQFNFLAILLAPPDTKIVAHMHLDKCGSWELNEEVGQHISPLINHYKCVKYFFSRTIEERDCDTVEFFPYKVLFPKITLIDYLK